MKQKNCFGGVAEDIYSGTATFGKDYAWIVSMFCFVIAAVMIIVGIYFIGRPPAFPIPVKFKINTVTPKTTTKYIQQPNGASIPQIETVYDLIGTVDGCTGNVTLNGYPHNVISDTVIDAYMQANCKNNIASANTDSTTMIGWIVIIIAICLILYNLARLYFVGKYKGAAALQGVAGGGNILKNIFK